jgi:hypothetical protein
LVAQAAPRGAFVGQPKVQVIEELWCFQTEVMKISCSVDWRDVHQGDELAVRLDQFRNTDRLLKLIRGQRAFAATPFTVDDAAQDQRPVVRGNIDRQVPRQGIDLPLELLVEFVVINVRCRKYYVFDLGLGIGQVGLGIKMAEGQNSN